MLDRYVLRETDELKEKGRVEEEEEGGRGLFTSCLSVSNLLICACGLCLLVDDAPDILRLRLCAFVSDVELLLLSLSSVNSRTKAIMLTHYK